MPGVAVATCMIIFGFDSQTDLVAHILFEEPDACRA
jgi:hypothetical protein